MKIIEIVRAHLVAGGFDGLVLGEAECACLLDDLQPCGESMSLCRPGYRHDERGQWGQEWVVSTRKPDAAEVAPEEAQEGDRPPMTEYQKRVATNDALRQMDEDDDVWPDLHGASS